MQTRIRWKGFVYHSLEHCLVSETPAAVLVNAVITGSWNEKLFQAAYRLQLTTQWQTIAAQIDWRYDDKQQSLELKSDGNGNWLLNGNPQPAFAGCYDIDIPLTPLTNTLPIRRLLWNRGQSRELRMIYCDLPTQSFEPVYQRYTCVSANQYHYENVPNDFEATISVDQQGLVTDYPQLFTRIPET